MSMTMTHAFANLSYHANFSTEDRRPSIEEDFRDRLLGDLGGILDRHDLVCDDRFANG